ncbi:MAG: PBP1A family penicillin-binding protein [Acidobacteriota bacterium]
MAKKAKVSAKSRAYIEDDYDEPVTGRRSHATQKTVSKTRRSRARLLFKSSYILVPLALVLGIVLYVYYQKYSAIIDSGLQGKVFERQPGVYAAPLVLRNGAPLRMGDLIAHLQGVGYVQVGSSETGTRGRYAVIGNMLDVLPSSDVMIDGVKAFPQLQIAFGPGGYGIQSLTSADSQQSLAEAMIEPEQISAAVNQQREKRKVIDYKDLPASLIAAIVVIEDRDFFTHSGISFRGILRALFRNYEAGEIREGGSTITQQLVKGFFLTPERTPKRKLAEAYMSIILEQKLSKEQIMTLYCNQIYLGQRGGFSINGFGEAARAYFGKDVSYLTASESAMLAGIVRSPNYYSPYSHEDRARDRRNFVLSQLVNAGPLTPKHFQLSPAEAETAKQQRPVLVSKTGTDASDAPYFVDYVTRQLEDQYAEDTQSMRAMRIYTTVDLDLQRAAVAAVDKHIREIEAMVAQKRGRTTGLQVALVAMNAQNGDVLAMIGGRDYANSQLNRATEARRQPGSVFKPFVYAAALSETDPERRITPASVFTDAPHTFEGGSKPYEPGNFGDSYEYREMTAREALTKSKNVIAVTVAQRVGYTQVAAFAERAGLSKVPAVPSVALGVAEATPLQMAAAYTSFANRGTRVAPIGIRRITSKEGKTIFTGQTQASEVMSPQVSFLMSSMMQDVLDYGTGLRVRQMGFRETAAGKTGSSRDAWFAGYTKGLVCVVWIGFDDNADIGVTGGSTAALIWGDFMIRALHIRPQFGGPFNVPTDGLVTLYVNPATGQPAQMDTPGARAEIFLNGTQPGQAGAPVTAPIPVNPPSDTPPSGIERAATAPAVTIPPRDGSLLGGGSDAFIPMPPGTSINTPGAPQPATTPARSIIRSATDKPLPARPIPMTPVPQRAAPQPTPAGRSTQRSPGPTPWPTPKFTAQAQPPKPKPTIIVIGKPAPDQRATRPRVVPTPTPAAKSKASASTAKANAKDKKKAGAKSGQTQAAKVTKTPPSTKAKPAPKPTPVKLAAAPPTPTPIPKPVTTLPPLKSVATSSGKTFFMEVCSVSGLIPVKGLCKPMRRQFHVGQEPTRQCSSDRHNGN